MRKLVEKHVEGGSTVISDAARFYHNLGDWGGSDNGLTYTHKVVNHSAKESPFVNSDGDHTNLIESTWRTIREYIGLGRIQATLDYHLSEVLWRRHCKKSNLDPFLSLIAFIKNAYPGLR